MGQRDAIAHKKRETARMKSVFALTDARVNETREARLFELYREDEKRYEQELSQSGMAFRRDIV